MEEEGRGDCRLTAELEEDESGSAGDSPSSWTAVDPATDGRTFPDDVARWNGAKSQAEMTRDEDFLLIDAFLAACALTEEDADVHETDADVADAELADAKVADVDTEVTDAPDTKVTDAKVRDETDTEDNSDSSVDSALEDSGRTDGKRRKVCR